LRDRADPFAAYSGSAQTRTELPQIELPFACADMVEVIGGVSFRQRPTITHGQKHELHVDDRDPAGTNQGRKLLSADPFKLIPFIEVPMIMPVLMSANCKA
jgi:hypothetical protein